MFWADEVGATTLVREMVRHCEPLPLYHTDTCTSCLLKMSSKFIMNTDKEYHTKEKCLATFVYVPYTVYRTLVYTSLVTPRTSLTTNISQNIQYLS